MFDCLVCGKPTKAMHMGLDACRACAVFFRRRCENGETLECIRGKNRCNKNGKRIMGRTCRKCRQDRFEEVLRAASADDELAFGIPAKSSDKDAEFKEVMDGILTIESPASDNSIIEKIRVNYQKLCKFRLYNELKSRGITINAEENGWKYDLIPSTYQHWNEGMRIKLTGLFEFVPNIFPEFNTLPSSHKWSLINNYLECFHCLDSSMQVRRRFGKAPKNIFFLTFTTYISLDTIDSFFSDCPNRSNANEAANQVHQMDPSDYELHALMGLAFWSVETLEPSDELLALASRYRAAIINELTAHYRGTIGVEQGASRIGSLLCMLQEIRRVVMNLPMYYEIYHMLGAFDDDTLTYKLQKLELSA